MTRAPQRYEITVHGVHHGLEVTSPSYGTKRLSYFHEGIEVARQQTGSRRARVTAGSRWGSPTVDVRFTGNGTGVRRATLHLPDGEDADATAGPTASGLEIDLVPVRGTRARRLWDWGQAHPFLYALRHVLTGDLGFLLVFLLAGGVIDRILSWVGRETAPVTDAVGDALPSLPAIPWPDWHLPAWLGPLWHVLDVLSYAWPVVAGLVLAGLELRRNGHQRELRERVGQA